MLTTNYHSLLQFKAIVEHIEKFSELIHFLTERQYLLSLHDKQEEAGYLSLALRMNTGRSR